MTPTDPMLKIARASCDPLWIQHRFLATGHDETLENGTATFIKFKDHHFICTCRHVAEAAKGDFVPALMAGQLILNIASMHPDRVYRHNFRSPENYDIAIAPMTGFHFELMQSRKGKAAIDLDAWETPEWSTEGTLAAAGYLNEHKYSLADKVATPMNFAVAELASSIGPQLPTFTLSSVVDEAHGLFFSGMSGGPVFISPAENKLIPVGIIFEGGPSSGRFKNLQTSIGAADILIRAHTLTPTIFESWLAAVDLLPSERPIAE
ncbi:hypothetical protein [Bradyrhizobium sp. CCBAU 65884]|uniref:hypothetical protein n=1 Tax=Bradyrhizobium sp. CCBAU 65884 TaxID=722477 RepID=UPI002304DC0D|nr:hypothetical protein [Bradyrhizobium sp. CCBAU 65884]